MLAGAVALCAYSLLTHRLLASRSWPAVVVTSTHWALWLAVAFLH
jgi:hypothetical protein